MRLLLVLSVGFSSILATQFSILPTLFKLRNNKKNYLGTHRLTTRSEDNPVEVTCAMCQMAADTMLGWLKTGSTRDMVVSKATTLCVAFGIQQRHVCQGALEAHMDTLLFIEAAKRNTDHPIKSDDVCYLSLYPECPLPGPHYEWTLDLDFLGPKPDVPQPQPPAEETMHILHITDAHIDLEYTPGNNANCKTPSCCRSDSGVASKEEDGAGYWGDYRDCDSPPHAFTDLVQQAAKAHPDVAYVAFTGDIVSHAMWSTSIVNNTKVISSTLKQMKEAFPGKMVLPILGNHEPHPFNAFSVETPKAEIPDNLSTTWLYKLSQEEWGFGDEQSATIAKGGYYAIEVKPGLLVIGINNNLCYNYNWWQMLDPSDPAGQLKWLAETLLNAEKQGQKVHILAHLPANSASCLSHWRKIYMKIMHRFESTVVAQFHGHEHTDYFTLFYDPEDNTRTTSVGFIAGSATAYSHVNPSYRIYIAEAQDNFRVLDFETWYYNLTEANLAGPDVPPKWSKLYSFNEAFGTTNMFPTELNSFVVKLAASEELLDKFYRYHVREADTAVARGCDPKCRRKLVCDMITPDPENRTKCDALAAQGDLLRTISEIYEAELYADEAREAKEKEEKERLEKLGGTTDTVTEHSHTEESSTEASVSESETPASESESSGTPVEVTLEANKEGETNLQEESTTEITGETHATVTEEVTEASVEPNSEVEVENPEVPEEKSAKLKLDTNAPIQNDNVTDDNNNNVENSTTTEDKNTSIENSTEATEVTKQDTGKEITDTTEITSDLPETSLSSSEESSETTEVHDSWTTDSEAETIKMDSPMLKQQFMEVLHGPDDTVKKSQYLGTKIASFMSKK